MKTKAMRLEDLFFMKICALYDIETEITKALPKMAKAAKTSVLRDAFQGHLKETLGQIERLKKFLIFLIRNLKN